MEQEQVEYPEQVQDFVWLLTDSTAGTRNKKQTTVKKNNEKYFSFTFLNIPIQLEAIN